MKKLIGITAVLLASLGTTSAQNKTVTKEGNGTRTIEYDNKGHVTKDTFTHDVVSEGKGAATGEGKGAASGEAKGEAAGASAREPHSAAENK